MTRNIFLFLGTFIAGALIALVTRAALFNPHRGHEGHPAKAEYAPMVSNALTPTPAPQSIPAANQPASAAKPAPAAPSAASDPHAGHGAISPATPAAGAAVATPAKAGQPVNTVCAICGMDVDPKLPTLEYKGQTIGFGCKMCAPKFKADPDRYGPTYLRNELLKK